MKEKNNQISKKLKKDKLGYEPKVNKSLFILMIIIFALSCVLTSVLIAYGFVNKQISDKYTIYLSLLATLIVLSAFFSVLFFIKFLRQRDALSRISISIKSKRFIPDLRVFKKRVTRLIKRNVEGGNALIAISIKNFKEEYLITRGSQFIFNYLTSLSDSIDNELLHSDEAIMGFDLSETFFVYLKTSDVREVINFAKEINIDIDEAMKNNGSFYNPVLSYGAYCFTYERGSFNIDQAVSNAEIASYRESKFAESNSNVNFFDKSMNIGDGNLDMDVALVKALERKEFQIFYQPQYDLNKKRFTGAEALIRWLHPERGLIGATAFIPIAEQSGRIIDIDKYVFDRVCSDIAKWTKEGKRLIPISVNLSRRSSYEPQMLDYMKAKIEEYHVNPLLLKLELTESIASKNITFTEYFMKKVKEMNIKVALDDVGTGYSSLSVLKNLPIDVAKLDKSFFDDIEVDKKARDVVSALAKLCHDLGMYVLAEGIQNSKQIAIVSKLGIDCIQGFYYSQAIPIHSYEAFLASNKFEERK